MTDKTGGQAFPLPPSEHMYADAGMTLRDYFAAKAMQGDWATQTEDMGYFPPQSADVILDNTAELYYRMADAMLRAREK
ncbi:hypothetical protein [Morganella morganii]|uniref:hypothetical protein n=1 Tax=Morganella morganii TaxID=582 RepID=UPI003EC04AB5